MRYAKSHNVVMALLLGASLAWSSETCAAPAGSSKVSKAPSATELNAVEPLRELHAVSADIDTSGKTYIVVFWKRAADAAGYNIYRKDESAAFFPSSPLNTSGAVTEAKTCTELKAVIPEGSAEWAMISDAFSSLRLKQQLESGEGKGGVVVFKPHSGTEKAPVSPRALTQGLPSSRFDISLMKVDPCDAFERGLTPQEEALLDMMAAANLKIRLIRGSAFLDEKVSAGKTYVYQIGKIRAGGAEEVLPDKVKVKAGHFIPPDPPDGLTAFPGDTKVLVLWNRRPQASGFIVARSVSPAGPYQQVHQETVIYDIDKDLKGDPLPQPKPGLVDFQRWDEDGNPIAHKVTTAAGVTVFVNGPANNTTYYYKVASVDILGRKGPWSSSSVAAKPLDMTPPRAPTDLKVDAVLYPPGISISFRKVTMDVLGHKELDTTSTYNIYRSDDLQALEDVSALSPSSHLFVHSLTAVPSDATVVSLSWTDNSPALIQPYGEKDFFYRVQCVDKSGNTSAPSAVVSGRIPDTTPPGPTKMTGAEGYADHIRVFWDQNREKDLGGYQIYVGLCDMGAPYRPRPKDQKDSPYEPCDFALVGELLASEANKRLEETGSLFYDDYSVTPGSSVCYAYWVRAFDTARNVYPGSVPGTCPDRQEYVCQKLLEEKAPPVPVISALKARNNSVLIEWVASPLQDLKAFHVYRSTKENEPPSFVATVFTDGTVSPVRWEGIRPRCEDIPAEANPTAILASFEDKGLEPNRVYWYRVSALDWLGNESEKADIARIPAVSTFTYTRDVPAAPVVLPQGPQLSHGCGLKITWAPLFDPGTCEGFMVFRGPSAAGPFRQVSPLVKGNEFTDTTALRGLDHFYRVQAMDRLGNLSEPSAAVLYRY